MWSAAQTHAWLCCCWGRSSRVAVCSRRQCRCDQRWSDQAQVITRVVQRISAMLSNRTLSCKPLSRSELMQTPLCAHESSSCMSNIAAFATAQVRREREAQHANLATIRHGIMQEVERSFRDVSGSAAFLALPLASLTSLLVSDHLAVDSEMQVWEAVAAWVQHEPRERSGHLTRLMGATTAIARQEW